jgi:hypothetical protein
MRLSRQPWKPTRKIISMASAPGQSPGAQTPGPPGEPPSAAPRCIPPFPASRFTPSAKVVSRPETRNSLLDGPSSVVGVGPQVLP